MWLKVAGPMEPFVAFGDADWPLNFFQADIETPDGGRPVIASGLDQDKIDPTDVGAAQEVLHRLCPDLKVLDVAAHDWLNESNCRRNLVYAPSWIPQGASRRNAAP